MKKSKLSLGLLVCGVLVMSMSGCSFDKPLISLEESGKEVKETVMGNKNTGFELELYKGLSESGKNLVFSPYSLKDAISLLYNAADGDTKKQMEEVIGLSDEAFKFYREYDEQDKYGISVANKAFYSDEDDMELNLDVLGTDDIEQVDMKNDAVDVINEYIADKTHDKITGLAKDGQFNESIFVLVNALYFNQNFDFEDKNITWSDDNYYSGFGGSVSLSNVKEANGDIDVLKLDYLNDEDEPTDCSLYIICDSAESDGRRADEFVKGLSDKEFNNLLDFSSYNGLKGYDKAKFLVPDFEIEFTQSMTDTLKDMGFTEAFNETTTDFNRFGEVYVDDILQGNYIKTDEKGTEAASAVLISGSATAALEKIKLVEADDEFVYVVKDNASDTILFMGKVSDSSAFSEESKHVDPMAHYWEQFETKEEPVEEEETVEEEEPVKEEEPVEEEVQNMSDLDLYNKVREGREDENFVFSPYSIKDCFSIIEPAVRGKMREQMDAVLGFNQVGAEVYADYDKSVNDSPYKALSVANKAFINKEDEVAEDLLSNSGIERIEMLPDGYAHINSFIEDNTNGKIKNLLSTSDIDEDTSIVLVNALHFLRPWNFNKGQIAFSDDKVYKAFKSNEYSVRDVKEDGDIDVLRLRYTKTPEEMAYSGNLHDYSMYIICDSDNSEVEGVNDFVKGLSTEDFKKLLDFDNYAGLSEYAEVDFVVPNFRVEFKDSLKQTLIDLGMTEGLDCDTLDMTDISENIVRIGDVIHGAFIETDEKGTEAAASTAVTMVKNDSFRIEDPKNVKHVVADTPYMFIVKDDTADVILFMGYIKEPAELQ